MRPFTFFRHRAVAPQMRTIPKFAKPFQKHFRDRHDGLPKQDKNVMALSHNSTSTRVQHRRISQLHDNCQSSPGTDCRHTSVHARGSTQPPNLQETPQQSCGTKNSHHPCNQFRSFSSYQRLTLLPSLVSPMVTAFLFLRHQVCNCKLQELQPRVLPKSNWKSAVTGPRCNPRTPLVSRAAPTPHH